MELFTRLINEGVFVFWKDENDENQHELKISLFNGDNKVTLIKKIMEEGQNFYSLTNIGAGDYEIELTSVKANKPTRTVVKKVKLTSSTQREVELMDKIDAIYSKFEELKIDVTYPIEQIRDMIKDPDSLGWEMRESYASFIKSIKRGLR